MQGRMLILSGLEACWTTLGDMAPYLLFGFLVAGLLTLWVRPEVVERHLGGRGWTSIWKASLLGVPLPLCSCGVIPVAASLRRHGASRGATTAFLLSTPQTGVDSIFVTYSLMGLVFAVVRPVAAFITGLIGGALVDRWNGNGPAAPAPPPRCPDECCVTDPRRRRLAGALHYGFVVLPRDIGGALIIGLLVAGVIAAVIPDDFFAGWLSSGLVGMLVMMAAGIPLYVCATGSVPIAAALVGKGISPGAALVFLMTGPATNAATLAVIWKTMGKKTALIYLISLAACALFFGLLLDQLIPFAGLMGSHHHGEHGWWPRWVNDGCALLLLAVLGWSYLRPVRQSILTGIASPASQPVILVVSGMKCSQCVENVGRALGECPGVTAVEVDLRTGRAQVTGTHLRLPDLQAAVAALGYSARLAATPPAPVANNHQPG